MIKKKIVSDQFEFLEKLSTYGYTTLDLPALQKEPKMNIIACFNQHLFKKKVMPPIICIFRKFWFKSGRVKIRFGYFSIRFLKMKKIETMKVIDRQIIRPLSCGALFFLVVSYVQSWQSWALIVIDSNFRIPCLDVDCIWHSSIVNG